MKIFDGSEAKQKVMVIEHIEELLEDFRESIRIPTLQSGPPGKSSLSGGFQELAPQQSRSCILPVPSKDPTGNAGNPQILQNEAKPMVGTHLEPNNPTLASTSAADAHPKSDRTGEEASKNQLVVAAQRGPDSRVDINQGRSAVATPTSGGTQVATGGPRQITTASDSRNGSSVTASQRLHDVVPAPPQNSSAQAQHRPRVRIAHVIGAQAEARGIHGLIDAAATWFKKRFHQQH